MEGGSELDVRNLKFKNYIYGSKVQDIVQKVNVFYSNSKYLKDISIKVISKESALCSRYSNNTASALVLTSHRHIFFS